MYFKHQPGLVRRHRSGYIRYIGATRADNKDSPRGVACTFVHRAAPVVLPHKVGGVCVVMQTLKLLRRYYGRHTAAGCAENANHR
jgi:hypothetical protein